MFGNDRKMFKAVVSVNFGIPLINKICK